MYEQAKKNKVMDCGHEQVYNLVVEQAKNLDDVLDTILVHYVLESVLFNLGASHCFI